MTSQDDYNPAEQIKEISANLKQPDKFAEIFCAAAKSQKKIDAALREIFITLIKGDVEFRDSLKSIIKESNKEDIFFYLKLVGAGIWSIGFLVLGGFITYMFSKHC